MPHLPVCNAWPFAMWMFFWDFKFLCVRVFCLHAYLHTTYMPGAHRGQRRALDLLKLEDSENNHVGADNRTWSSTRTAKCCLVFETRSHCVDQAGPEIPKIFCFYFWNAGNKGMWHHSWLKYYSLEHTQHCRFPWNVSHSLLTFGKPGQSPVSGTHFFMVLQCAKFLFYLNK